MTLPVGRAVQHFMELMGQEVPDSPRWPDEDTMLMRAKLIDEEIEETGDAYAERDMAAFLDGIVDSVYVLVGMAVAAGLPFDAAFDAVHRANMAKAPECADCNGNGKVHAGDLGYEDCEECDGKGRIVIRREDGKVLKPEGWEAPDIQSIIDAHAVV